MNGFLMTIQQAEEFFKRCAERAATTLEERLVILKEMQEERRVFPQSEQQIQKRLGGRKVLRIKHDDNS